MNDSFSKYETIDLSIITLILNKFPFHKITKINEISFNRALARYTYLRKPLINNDSFIKVYKFPKQTEEAYSLVNLINTKLYRYATSHYGKIKLWENHSSSLTINLEKTAKYELKHMENSVIILCFSFSNKIEVINLEYAKAMYSITLDYAVVSANFMEMELNSQSQTLICAPYLTRCSFGNVSGEVNETLLDRTSQYNYMNSVLYFKYKKYLVSLNSKGALFLFELNINNDLQWNFINKNDPKSEKNDYICSLLEFTDNRLGMELPNRTIKIVTLPDLECKMIIKYPTFCKLCNLGYDLGEDILFSIDQTKRLCYFIFPFEIKDKKTHYIELPIDKFKLIEGYQKISLGRSTVFMYTKESIYQINILL